MAVREPAAGQEGFAGLGEVVDDPAERVHGIDEFVVALFGIEEEAVAEGEVGAGDEFGGDEGIGDGWGTVGDEPLKEGLASASCWLRRSGRP